MSIDWSSISALTFTTGKQQFEYALFLRPYQGFRFLAQLVSIGNLYAQTLTTGLQALHMPLPQAGLAIDNSYCFEQSITVLQTAIES